MKKQLSLLLLTLIITLNSFSQNKDSLPPAKPVIVEFKDSLEYASFLNYLGTIPVGSPYANLFPYFKSLPVSYLPMIADKPKVHK